MSESDDPTTKRSPNDPDKRSASDAEPTIDAELTIDSAAPESASADFDGHRSIGPYLLVKQLGEGGMGQVWLAHQNAPVKRQVALKLIRAGLYNKSILQRFQSERQSLAIMDHPAIAKVFDAGATPDGQPYFVMEYVHGLPITAYCDRKRLGIRERLELFTRVCEGVQHAHQKAIIHRDLKPANILVVEVDGKPMPRIIDFGLAKDASPQVTEETMVTRFGGFVGTPGYMSPEQADPGAGDVDTRTDVYSLGVILYVLLTGFLPFDAEDWNTKSVVEMVRQLREDDPPLPSTKVSTEGESSSVKAERRGTEPRQLASVLRGDLDWIAMKALEKDRARRYGTPSELAADIGRYLKHEPVLARPASPGYRLRKYARRHWVGVSVAGGLALLLIGFAGIQAVQVRRITRERDRANRITDFMTGMFKVSDPSEARGNAITVREILYKASNEIGTGLAKDPPLQAQMMYVMGEVYRNLGLYVRSQSLLERAVEIQRRVLGADNPETFKSLAALAETHERSGHLAEAEKMCRENLELAQRAFGPKDPKTVRSLGNLGVILEVEGRYAEAEKTLREALGLGESVFGIDGAETQTFRENLGLVQIDLGEFAEAEKSFRAVLLSDQATLGLDHPQTLDAMNNLAIALSNQGHLADAEKIEREMVAIQLRVHGPEHPDTLRSLDNLGSDISDQGRYSEGEKIERDALAIERRVLGPEHPQTLMSMGNLVNTLAGEHRYAEAEKLEEETIAIHRRIYGADNPTTALIVYNLACLKALEGKREEALTALRQSVDHGLAPRTGIGIADDEDLISLRGDPRFEAIVADAHQRAVRAQKPH